MNWNELVEPEVLKTMGLFLGLGVVAYVSAKDLKRQNRRQRVKAPAGDIRRYINSKTLDSTKRKSLQPANQKPTPLGWTDADEKRWLEANIKVKDKHIDQRRPVNTQLTEKGLEHIESHEFVHKFFGSRLLLDGYVVKGGLTNKLHTLEITKGDKLFIDGQGVTIHPNELIKLKKGLLKIQNPEATDE